MDARANNGVYKQRTVYPEAMLKESVHLNAAAAPHIPSRRQRKKWPAATIAGVFQSFFLKKDFIAFTIFVPRPIRLGTKFWNHAFKEYLPSYIVSDTQRTSQSMVNDILDKRLLSRKHWLVFATYQINGYLKSPRSYVISLKVVDHQEKIFFLNSE